MKNFTPNELKAIWFHYGTARRAAKELGIGTGTLIEQATQDLKGREYGMSEKVRGKIAEKYSSLSTAEKRKIQGQRKILDKAMDTGHTPVVRAIVNTKREREKVFRDFEKYSKKTDSDRFIFMGVMNNLYHRNPSWRFGQWKK